MPEHDHPGTLEDMPMNRYSNPIPICRCGDDQQASTEQETQTVRELLACQNQLLMDLVGAVNGLMAALLSRLSHGDCAT